jgi:hypothetical protein
MSARAPRIALLLLGAAVAVGVAFAACGGAAPVGESPAGGVRRERTDAGPGQEPSVPDAGEEASGW